MQDKYGDSHCRDLKRMSEKIIKASTKFYEDLIDLYRQEDEDSIVEYLNNIAHD